MRRRQEWDSYLSAHGHADVLVAFVRILPELDGEVYWRLFRDPWERAESFSPKDLWVTLLSCHAEHRNCMMSVDERTQLATLPNTFDVYRGVAGAQYTSGFSWTTDQTRAEWFARRFVEEPLAAAVRLGHGFDPSHEREPSVVRGTVQRADVIAFLGDRQESEIIALPEHVLIREVLPLETP
jgi:hypothetical protein